MTFAVDDHVQPKPPHKHDHAGRPLPSGRVLEVEPYDQGQRLRIDGHRGLMFLAGYFEVTSHGA